MFSRRSASLGKKGFTLIEMIVVIGILAILTLILVPAVSQWIEHSKDSVAKANAKQFMSSVEYTLIEATSGLLGKDAMDSASGNSYQALTNTKPAPSNAEEDKKWHPLINEIYDRLEMESSRPFEALAKIKNGKTTQIAFRDISANKVYVCLMTDQPEGSALKGVSTGIWHVFENAGSDWVSKYFGNETIYWNGN